MSKPAKTMTALCALALALTSPLLAGTVIAMDRRDLPDGTAEPIVVSIEGELVAVTGASDDGRLIFRGDRGQMWVIDDEEKTYMVLDETMVTGLATQLSAMQAQMEEALKSLPEAQREAARRMMQQQAPPAATAPTEPTEVVNRTNESATREGFPCVKYEVFEGDEKVRELWVTAWSNVEGRGDIENALESMSAFVDQLVSSFARLGGDASMSASMLQWHGIDGLPVVTTEIENGVAVEESVVRSLESKSIDGATFEVTAEYTLQTLGR